MRLLLCLESRSEGDHVDVRLVAMIVANVALLIVVGAVGIQATDGFDKTSIPIALAFYGLLASLIGLSGYALYRALHPRQPS